MKKHKRPGVIVKAARRALQVLKSRRAVWRSRDGRMTRIMDMDDGHLLNSTNLVLARPGWRDWAKPILEKECARRGMAAEVGTRPKWLNKRNKEFGRVVRMTRRAKRARDDFDFYDGPNSR